MKTASQKKATQQRRPSSISQDDGLVRLNVLLQRYGVASRRKADELIQSGVVKVNKKVVNTVGTKIKPTAVVTIEGRELTHIPDKVTYLFHKPNRTITSRKDLQGRQTIYDLPELKKIEPNVQAVGRLDYRSEGLLVLTNDGELALALSHPKYSVEKTYSVLLSTQVSADEIDKLRRGIQLEDGLAKPLSVKPGQKEKLGQSTGQWLELVVTEGRNRLIRRMMESLGLNVVKLVRVAIGDLRIPFNLPPGSLRALTQIEKKYLDRLVEDMHKETQGSKTAKLKKEKSKFQAPAKKSGARSQKTSLNDKEYEKEVQNRNRKVQELSKDRKKKFEEKIKGKIQKKTVPQKEISKRDVSKRETPKREAPKRASSQRSSSQKNVFKKAISKK